MIARKYLTQRQKIALIDKQDYRCAICTCDIRHESMIIADHKLSLVDGGTNVYPDNWQIICCDCNKIKSAMEHIANAKTKRIRYGKARKSKPMAGSKRSPWKKKMSGEVIRRD